MTSVAPIGAGRSGKSKECRAFRTVHKPLCGSASLVAWRIDCALPPNKDGTPHTGLHTDPTGHSWEADGHHPAG